MSTERPEPDLDPDCACRCEVPSRCVWVGGEWIPTYLPITEYANGVLLIVTNAGQYELVQHGKPVGRVFQYPGEEEAAREAARSLAAGGPRAERLRRSASSPCGA